MNLNKVNLAGREPILIKMATNVLEKLAKHNSTVLVNVIMQMVIVTKDN